MTGVRRFLLAILLLSVLSIPAFGAAQAAPPAQETVHVVQAGDTLSAIAQKYGVSLQSIMAVNGISNPSLIYIGQRLAIPGAAAPAASTTASIEYVVGSGDTLAGIARQAGITVAAIAAANGITDPAEIYVGQRLALPAGAATPPAQTVPEGGLHFTVNISQQRCQLHRGERLLYDWPCSTGRAGFVTTTGEFLVQSKIHEAWGSRWGFYMPFWLGIYWAGGSENGIHGLPYQPGGYPVWANSVGTPITYGCVLLGADEAQTLWDMAYIGMPVTIRS